MKPPLLLRAGRLLLTGALTLGPVAAFAGDSDLFPGFTSAAPPVQRPAPVPNNAPAPSAPASGTESAGAAEAAAIAPAAGTAAPSSTEIQDPLNNLLDRLPATTPPDAPLAEPAVVPGPQDLWQRIRGGFRIPDLETKLADQRTRWYAEQVEYFARMAQRSSRYLYFIVQEIERRGMPTELALLPFVESAFQPEAVSSAKAAGLWQFIPSTGKDYALEQTMWKDERRSVIDSTRAALDYLQKLYDMFGDWHLALAAYNWGEGSVSRAIDKNRRAGRSTKYTSLKMPLETQHYVPKLQAVKNIVAEPEKYGIDLPPVPNSPYFVAVQKSRDIDVGTAARLAGMTPEEFRALNPQFNRPIIVGAAAPTLLLPADRLDVFNANLAAWEATGQPLASWTTYRLQPTDTLATVAKRAGITEQQLREANRVPPRYRLAAGSTILIPRDETMDDIPAHSLDAQFALVPEASNLRKVTYRVRRGDTLYSVARRYNVSEHDVILWNNLTGPGLFAGQRLELTIPMARSRATPKSTKASAKPARHPATTHTSNQAAPKSAKGAAATHGKVAAASR